MTVAEAKQTTIYEGLSTSAKVDREAGVVRNVKLIGFESKNGRVYPPHVLKAAVHLYENAKVNIDHPVSGATEARSYSDRFGMIKAVRFVEGSGLFGDFHYNPKHQVAEQFAWDAENNPASMGFSHNATLRLGPKTNGKQVIESIIAIRSMDLVADPATTTSLFESEDPNAMDDQPMTPSASDPKDQIKAAFKQMISAAIDDESLDMKSTMAKIKEIMKAQEKLMGGGSSAPETEEKDDMEKPAEEGVAFQVQIANLKQELEGYKAKEREASITESIDEALVAEGLDPKNPTHVSELFAKTLRATESADDRLALIKDRAAVVGSKPRQGTPVYQPGTTTVAATEQIDPKTFASRLLV
jgi:hypothetical protein